MEIHGANGPNGGSRPRRSSRGVLWAAGIVAVLVIAGLVAVIVLGGPTIGGLSLNRLRSGPVAVPTGPATVAAIDALPADYLGKSVQVSGVVTLVLGPHGFLLGSPAAASPAAAAAAVGTVTRFGQQAQGASSGTGATGATRAVGSVGNDGMVGNLRTGGTATVLVVSARRLNQVTPAPSLLLEGSTVQVTGIVQQFDLVPVSQDLGVDLSSALYAPYANRPVILASAITG